MHCLKCGCKWRIGNMSPNISCCPICGTNFKEDLEYRGYDSIPEFLICLIHEQGDEICLNNLQITSYLNDFFPTEVVLREKIEELLKNGIGEYVYQYRKGNEPLNDLKTIVNQSGLDNYFYDIEKTVNYLTGRNVEEGTNTEIASFYIDQEDDLQDIVYKIAALEKANRISPDSCSQKRQADLLIEIGEYDSAIEILEKASESDDETIILQLAAIYEKGEIVEKDNNRAAELYFQLEKQNSAEGFYKLGRLYYLGKGVEKSISQAVEYLSRSAEKGNHRAQYFLYKILYKDNPIVATYYLAQSAALNFEPAMYDFAIHLLYGDDIKKNVPYAVHLLEECAKHGNRDAASKLYFMYMTGYEVEVNRNKAMQYKILLD